jgi:hypothetical protein
VRYNEPGSLGKVYETAVQLYEKHFALSGFCGDTFIGAAGIVRPYPSLGEAWAIGSQHAYTHKLYFHSTIKRVMVGAIRDMGLKRLQATVRADWPMGCKWVEKLGFIPEARLHNYGPDGADFYMYVIFPEEG